MKFHLEGLEDVKKRYNISIKTFKKSSTLFCVKYLITTDPYVLNRGVDPSPPKIFEVKSYPRIKWCCSHLPPLHQPKNPPNWAAHILSSSLVSQYTCNVEVPHSEADLNLPAG